MTSPLEEGGNTHGRVFRDFQTSAFQQTGVKNCHVLLLIVLGINLIPDGGASEASSAGFPFKR